jgi:drug/metabolite transporter (DMT)-like permease
MVANASALIAVVWLGLLGSGLAYLLYFRLLRNWAPAALPSSRTSCRFGASLSASSSLANRSTRVFW